MSLLLLFWLLHLLGQVLQYWGNDISSLMLVFVPYWVRGALRKEDLYNVEMLTYIYIYLQYNRRIHCAIYKGSFVSTFSRQAIGTTSVPHHLWSCHRIGRNSLGSDYISKPSSTTIRLERSHCKLFTSAWISSISCLLSLVSFDSLHNLSCSPYQPSSALLFFTEILQTWTPISSSTSSLVA